MMGRKLAWIIRGLVGAGMLASGALNLGAGVEAQDATVVRRPVPGPVVPPPFYRAAVESGTRSLDGRPGPRYWTQSATYEIDARLDPATGRVTATGRIRFENRSPDRLPVVVLNLYQNIHAPGVVRNEPQEVTGGATLERVAVNGTALTERPVNRGPGFQVEGTVMVIRPPTPVEPGGTLELGVSWAFDVPASGAGRMGHSGREMYFVAYWFPRLAVYDDLRGWDAESYQGAAEFYDDFGDYRVAITVPTGWTVMATGRLENAEGVLSAATRERLAAAVRADTMVQVATVEDLRAGRVTAPGEGGWLTWRFAAEGVRDFTFTTSNVQRWTATSARVGDRDGDGAPDRVAIHSFWRPDRAPLWADQALYGKHAIEHHSRYTGFDYPWPHMTSVEGADIIGGGMEFPMLTVIGPYTDRGSEDLYNVTSHELAHMWIPMIVGTNERRYAWMDEGFTSFLENQGRPEYWKETADPDSIEANGYLQVARAELEQPLMRHGDYYEPGPGYGTASYAKSATLLVTLRGLLGRETFENAYRSYVADWAFKHPAPWDFFNAVERVAGRDLDWFWSTWYYNTWTLDQSVHAVEVIEGAPVVVVRDLGFAPMPVRLRIETSAGGTLEREIGVSAWLQGSTEARLALPRGVGEVLRVEIDPDRLFPDVDRSNNVWTPS